MEEIERMEPEPKRFKPAVDSKNFDIVGTLMTEMGLTGENLTRQIFSYLDMTSLVRVRKVSNIWQRFMIGEKSIWTLIWMVELRKFEPHLEFIKNLLFRNKKRKESFSFATYCLRTQELTWDHLEKSSNIGLMESVYLEIQCLVALHHTWCMTPFEHYMADCYIGKAMKKQVAKFVKNHPGKGPERRMIELLTKIHYRLELP